MFYVAISGNVQRFQYFNSETEIAISEANNKTNRMVSTKWTYHKERSFGSNYSIFFWKFCFSLRTSFKEFIWYFKDPNSRIPTFCKHWSFIWRCFFPASILKVTVFRNKGFDIIIFFNDVNKKILSIDSNCIVLCKVCKWYANHIVVLKSHFGMGVLL